MITARRGDYPSRTYAVYGAISDAERDLDNVCARGDAIQVREDMWRRIEAAEFDPALSRKLLGELSGKPLTGLVSFDDADTQRTVRLADRLKLSSPAFGRAALTAIDKSQVYKLLQDAGLPVSEYVSVQRADEVAGALDTFGRPLNELVVKPSISTSSIGVYRPAESDTPETVADRVAALVDGKRTAFIVMPFLDGSLDGVREFCADGLWLDGDVVVMVLCEKIRQDSRAEFQDRLMVSPPISEGLLDLEPIVRAHIRDVLMALCCEASTFHIEFRFQEDGAFVPIDVALRPGGGFIVEAARASTGIDLRLCHVAAATDNKTLLRNLANTAGATRRSVAIGAFYSKPTARPDPAMIQHVLGVLDRRLDVIAFHVGAELTNALFTQADLGLSLALVADKSRSAVKHLVELVDELGLQ